MLRWPSSDREPTLGSEPASPESQARVFESLLGVLAATRRLAGDEPEFDWTRLLEALDHSRASLDGSDELFWVAHTPPGAEEAPALALRQARLAVLCLRLGQRLGYARRDLLELGLAAALADVSLWGVRETVLRGGQPASAAEARLMGSHADVSARMLAERGLPLPGVIAAVRSHASAAGTPVAGAGEPATLIAVAETYVRLTGSTAERARRPPHEAMREILRRRHAWPPTALRTLLGELTVFPPGSRVTLSTGDVAEVISVNRRHPLRPRVLVLGDSVRIVDLAENPFIFVAAADD